MQHDEKQRVIERYLDAYNCFDVDGMLALLSPAVRFENVSGGQVSAATTGIDAFRELAGKGAAMFAERRQTAIAWTFNPASVLVTIAWRGVLAVEVPDGPPAGTELKLQGESEFEFAGGLISRIVDRS
ncbi:nuclear transport factor 2 family protein [Rhodanobacter ginsengiterrae]|uniref:nuclear transport factor 2 family protein n=1 Tax=Rhodanobacter ginsengiterrae TaxID=2008451 RepID=UPI003CF4D3E7